MLGDSHNFGRRVTFSEAHGNGVFHKPRTVFWEYQFLDARSPFRKALRSVFPADFEMDSVLGDIPYEHSPTLDQGTCPAIRPFAGIRDSRWLERAGKWIALAMVFGWGDLHGENVIPTHRGLQLVDLECLFWDIALARESLIVPRKMDEWKHSVLGVIFPSDPGTWDAQAILLGIDSGFRVIQAHRDALIEATEALLKSAAMAPSRVILKDTHVYLAHLTGDRRDARSLLPEELEQLERGDVPYFLTDLDGGGLWYWKTATERAKVCMNPEIANKLRKSNCAPRDLLSFARLEKTRRLTLLEAGAWLIRPSGQVLNLGPLRISCDAGKVELRGGGFWLQMESPLG